MFQVGENFVAVEREFVPRCADKDVLAQGQQFAVRTQGQAVIGRDVAFLEEIACAEGGLRADVPIQSGVNGFVVVVFLGGTGGFAEGLRHYAAAHAAVCVQAA